MHYLQTYWLKALFLIHDRGLFVTLKKAVYVLYRDFQEWQFDRARNVNTRGSVTHPQESGNPLHLTAMPYDATTPMLFREIMMVTRGMDLPRTFFDMGCGKGRVLIMAAEHGFNDITGVEFDLPLARVAEKNITNFLNKKRKQANIDVVYCDAAAYSFPDKNAVIFFYNPFAESVMAKTLQNIRDSAVINRERYIIYHAAFFDSLVGNPAEYALLAKTDTYSIYRMIL